VTDPQSRPVPGAWTAGRPGPAGRPGAGEEGPGRPESGQDAPQQDAGAPPRPGPPVPGPRVPGPPTPAPPSPTPATANPPAQGPVGDGTGDPRVDAALARLDRLDELPVAEHVGEYDAVHRALQDALTTIDES
jgi:hypothetical protein